MNDERPNPGTEHARKSLDQTWRECVERAQIDADCTGESALIMAAMHGYFAGLMQHAREMAELRELVAQREAERDTLRVVMDARQRTLTGRLRAPQAPPETPPRKETEQ